MRSTRRNRRSMIKKRYSGGQLTMTGIQVKLQDFLNRENQITGLRRNLDKAISDFKRASNELNDTNNNITIETSNLSAEVNKLSQVNNKISMEQPKLISEMKERSRLDGIIQSSNKVCRYAMLS